MEMLAKEVRSWRAQYCASYSRYRLSRVHASGEELP